MPRITRAKTYLCNLPVESPRIDAMQAFTSQETILVELETDSGDALGVGYSYTIGTGGAAVREMVERELLPCVIGEDPMRPEAIWTRMANASRATMTGPITTLAMAAIDTAVWDLRCKRLGLPLWQAAGGAQQQVSCYDTEGGWLDLSPKEAAENAAAAVARGLHGVKIKIGKPAVRDDIARVAAVREAIGPDLALMVDANQAFTCAEAIRRAHLLEPYDLAWFEEPMPADDIQGHTELARATSIPIAAGETIYSLAQFREYLARGAIRVVQVDAARIGGITPWLKVAHLAEGFNVDVAPHFLMELHVSLAAAVPNGRWVEWIPQLDAVTNSPLSVVGGFATPPSNPGLGISWDRPALARYQVTDAPSREQMAITGRTD